MSSISVAKHKQKSYPIGWLFCLAAALVASKLAPRAKRRGIRFGFPRAERVELARKRQAVGIFARSANILVVSRKALQSPQFYVLANKINVISVIAPEPKAVATLLLEEVVPDVAIKVPSSNLHTVKYGFQAFGCEEFHSKPSSTIKSNCSLLDSV